LTKHFAGKHGKVNNFEPVTTLINNTYLYRSRIMRTKFLLYLIGLACTMAACKKWEDKKGNDDDRLNRPYCNDPAAVNFNWDFPGKPDNSVCFYPYEFFVGQYTFYDKTTYSIEAVPGPTYQFDISIRRDDTSRVKLLLGGFCATDIRFTADRYYKAFADSTSSTIDSSKLPGQLVCNPGDTLSGTVARLTEDSLIISFSVLTDTGIVNHSGKAVRKK
jgi:hypothetical protein